MNGLLDFLTCSPTVNCMRETANIIPLMLQRKIYLGLFLVTRKRVSLLIIIISEKSVKKTGNLSKTSEQPAVRFRWFQIKIMEQFSDGFDFQLIFCRSPFASLQYHFYLCPVLRVSVVMGRDSIRPHIVYTVSCNRNKKKRTGRPEHATISSNINMQYLSFFHHLSEIIFFSHRFNLPIWQINHYHSYLFRFYLITFYGFSFLLSFSHLKFLRPLHFLVFYYASILCCQAWQWQLRSNSEKGNKATIERVKK